MTRVLIVGDTHGHAEFVSNIHREARTREVDTIVQLGDFGYNFDRNLLASIQAWLDRDENHKWYWLDGNHDHHDFIEQTIMDGHSWKHPIPYFHDRMFYCPRGSTTMIGDKRCLFLGGAFSIDRSYRTEGVSWWRQEMIRWSDVERAIEAGTEEKVHVMFSHDAPPSEWLEEQLQYNGYKVGPESLNNRRTLALVVDQVRPDELYHGHYHWRYNVPYMTPEGWKVSVEGVGANVEVTARGQMLSPRTRYDDNFVIREW